MKRTHREYLKYIMILPRKLEVEIHRAEEGGFWAKVKGLPGCNTQGNDFFDLIDMINDAVLTYFEVPLKFRKFLGQYIPEIPYEAGKKLMEKIHHAQIEEVVNKIIKNKRVLEFNNVGLSQAH